MNSASCFAPYPISGGRPGYARDVVRYHLKNIRKIENPDAGDRDLVARLFKHRRAPGSI